MSSPFFTAIIPVHNKGPHIASAISSVLCQTFPDFELLVVDDGSIDNSRQKVEQFTDKRLSTLIRALPGAGGYAARNMAIARAKGLWLAFLDADDEWLPTHLAEIRQMIDRFPNVAVFGCACQIVDNRDFGHANYDGYTKSLVDPISHYLSFKDYVALETKGIRPLNGSTACIRPDIMKACGFFPAGKAQRGGDVDTWLRCIELSGALAYSAHLGAKYFRDSVNMVTRTAWCDASEQRATIRGMIPKYDKHTKALLKKVSNRRTISAWLHNLGVSGKGNFSLIGKLYWSEQPIISSLWIILSILPRPAVLMLRKIVSP